MRQQPWGHGAHRREPRRESERGRPGHERGCGACRCGGHRRGTDRRGTGRRGPRCVRRRGPPVLRSRSDVRGELGLPRGRLPHLWPLERAVLCEWRMQQRAHLFCRRLHRLRRNGRYVLPGSDPLRCRRDVCRWHLPGVWHGRHLRPGDDGDRRMRQLRRAQPRLHQRLRVGYLRSLRERRRLHAGDDPVARLRPLRHRAANLRRLVSMGSLRRVHRRWDVRPRHAHAVHRLRRSLLLVVVHARGVHRVRVRRVPDLWRLHELWRWLSSASLPGGLDLWRALPRHLPARLRSDLQQLRRLSERLRDDRHHLHRRLRQRLHLGWQHRTVHALLSRTTVPRAVLLSDRRARRGTPGRCPRRSRRWA